MKKLLLLVWVGLPVTLAIIVLGLSLLAGENLPQLAGTMMAVAQNAADSQVLRPAEKPSLWTVAGYAAGALLAFVALGSCLQVLKERFRVKPSRE